MLFFLLIAGGVYYYFFFPDVSLLRTHYPHVEYDAKTKSSSIRIVPNKPKGWASTKEVSRWVIGAVIVSEDWAFYQHQGFDRNQLQLAIQESIEKGRLGRGASTITQQVIKNIYFNNDRSVIRKALELVLATQIEAAVGKNRILEFYLNIAEMGPGIYGIRAAANYYFSKAPSSLDAQEGAFLAMLLPSPLRYGQSFRQKKLSKFARGTIDSILNKMVMAGYLTADAREGIRGTSLAFEQMPDPPAVEGAEHVELEHTDPEFVEPEELPAPAVEEKSNEETEPLEPSSSPDEG
jgi:monofunctional biosynthetic peptidoglycan transglycosylase